MESREKLKYLTEEEREKYLDLSSKKEELESLLLFKDSNGGYSVSDDYGSVGISTNLMNTRIEDYKDKLKELEDFIVARSNIEPPYYWDSKSESITKSEETRPTGEEELKRLEDWLVTEICMKPSERKRIDKELIKRGEFEVETRKRVKRVLSLAREEGKKEVVEKIRNAIKEDLKIEDIEKRHIKIDDDIVNILNDKGIKEMFLKDYEHGDIDNITNEDYELYKGWGFYS